MDFIKCKDLVFEYVRYSEKDDKKEHQRVLNGLDISIKKGEFVAILGHNGSGKSTLAKHFNALLTPTAGTVWIKGLDTADEENVWDIRQSAGMIFQNPDNQMVATIVEEDVAFGPENLGVPSAEIRGRVDDALKIVGMEDYMKSPPHLLSGGQKQRVCIASILAMKPDCIVLDEPTAMLDPMGRKEVIETVKKLNEEENITVILITHYMEEAVMAGRIIVLENGAVVMDDSPRNIFTQVDRMRLLGLDVPQVTELAHNLRSRGVDIPDGILTIEEMEQCISKLKIDAASVTYKEETAETEANVAISLRNVTHIYAKGSAFEKKALDDISLDIKKGEFVGLIGHTGSGKSTLIQHLNALIKPTYGEVKLYGQDIYADKSRLKEIRQRVGLVFQYPEHQLFEMTVYEDVAFGPRNMGLSKDEVDKMVRDALSIVDIKEKYFDKSPFELSGGQKRRVAIAGVLAMNPEILILDEPTAGLDPRGRNKILEKIKIMHDTLNITVILVSHSMEDIARLASKIIVVNEGRLEFMGDRAFVFKNAKRLEEIGLAAPQISLLMDRLNLPADIYTVSEAGDTLLKVIRN